jgi:hypothetical protein
MVGNKSNKISRKKVSVFICDGPIKNGSLQPKKKLNWEATPFD